ncbi:hypothetical protein F5X68DRAFT_246513 [Plectosphaerella plurivora]|uniref:Zn(2)-C6 fungal-type domain-containing protein n=1 Tax=Plectosphaerella plurivora TaxID=936078 RepID=A0A9P8V4T0_9PEZI|nr:hypothetical protein F5X68DRAFT_246513 [Plectosphaerella plurivora]
MPLQCDVCRERKTRCDATKPSCRFCKDLNIECIYSKPPHIHRRPKQQHQPQPLVAVAPPFPPRPDPPTKVSHEDPMKIVLDRLGKIESAIGSLSGRSPIPAQPFGTSKPEVATVYQGYWPTVRATVPSKQSKYAYRIPSMLVFETACPLHSRWSYNHSRAFYADQLGSVSDMSAKLRASLPPPDLSKSRVLDLQHAFVSDILWLFPVADLTKYQEMIKAAADTEYDAANVSTCFTLLACALALQCQILISLYYLINMRPLAAHRHLSRACQDITFIVRAGLDRETPDYHQEFRRIFWTSWLLENELELCLDAPSCGIRLYEKDVPLPTSKYEEEGMYNLLATISIRRLTADLEELEEYAESATACYGYLIAMELLKQLDEWQAHLPPPLKFPFGDTFLFNICKANLRCMYYVHKAILSWPPLAMRLGLKHVSDSDAEKLDQKMIDYGARMCLGATRMAIKSGGELMMRKSVLLHLVLRWYYSATMVLLLAASDLPQFEGHEPRQDHSLIREAYQTMCRWKSISFLNPPLAKMEEIMGAKGIL